MWRLFCGAQRSSSKTMENKQQARAAGSVYSSALPLGYRQMGESMNDALWSSHKHTLHEDASTQVFIHILSQPSAQISTREKIAHTHKI